MKFRLSRSGIFVLAAMALSVAISPRAFADFISEGGGNITSVPMYHTTIFGGIDRDGDGGFADEDVNGIDYVSNVQPRPSSFSDATVSANGATFRGIGQSAWSGFYAGRNSAQIVVSNANSNNDGYYLVAGTGTATSVQFFDQSAAAASATFTWHVTGTESNSSGFGSASGRLDFGASTDPNVNFFHLFDDPNNLLDSFTKYGSGDYSYTLPIVDLGTKINLFFWSSAFAEVKKGQAPQGSSFSLSANYFSTFALLEVKLVDANGNPIPQWSLQDLETGDEVFNQNGRIAGIAPAPNPVPEPATLSMLVGGLLTLAFVRRRT